MKKMFVLVLAAVLVAGTAAGLTINDLGGEKTEEGTENIISSDDGRLGLFSFNILFSSVTQSEPTLLYTPGQQAEFRFEIDVREDPTLLDGRPEMWFEINKCTDGINRGDLTRDDCNNPYTNYEVRDYGVDEIGSGDTVTMTQIVEMPESEGNYEVVAYVHQDWRLISDAPNTFVTVDAETSRDSDGDGVNDRNDEFPNDPQCVKDTDSDGFCDALDSCPRSSGVGPDGCPEPTTSDSDGDGVIDSEDACPSKPGPAERSGCPEKLPIVPIVGGLLVLGGLGFLVFRRLN